MPVPLVCYDINTDSESESDEDLEHCQDVKPEVVEVESSPLTVVTSMIEEIMDKVFHGSRDFSDMFIKEEPIDFDDDVKEEFDTFEYRDDVKIEMASDDSSSDESLSDNENGEDHSGGSGKTNEAPRTKNELQLCDLPPVEDLTATVNQAEVTKIGVVSSTVDQLVVVESTPGQPAIDLDSVLFLDEGARALGHVFDVIGPVSQPYYCVRFNSKEHILQKDVKPGMDVYFAPKCDQFTSYVFLDQLMKLKISDASWREDEEPPPQFLDYSDDEEERQAKKDLVITRMVRAGASEDEVAEKRAKLNAPRRRRPRQQASDQSINMENHDVRNNGNIHYNSQRHDNGLYNRTMNPFYREQRSYNPREMGPIQWSSYRPGGPAQPSYHNNPPNGGNYGGGDFARYNNTFHAPPPPPPPPGSQQNTFPNYNYSQPPPPIFPPRMSFPPASNSDYYNNQSNNQYNWNQYSSNR